MKVLEDYTYIGGGAQKPEMIVIHAMAENVRLRKDLEIKNSKGIVIRVIKAGVYPAHEWLKLLRLSCHFLEHPDGSFTKQRSTREICWHAKGYNTNSIGIEVLVKGTYDYDEFLKKIKTDWVTLIQYPELIKMCQGIIDFYGIKKVVRHSDLSPERKFDPGFGFKWEYFISKLTFND